MVAASKEEIVYGSCDPAECDHQYAINNVSLDYKGYRNEILENKERFGQNFEEVF